MAPRTRNSSIAVASISEPSPPPTAISGQDISSIDATTSNVVAPPQSPLIFSSLSKTISAHPPMFNPSTSGVFGFGYTADLPICGIIGQTSTAPIVSNSSSTSSFMASQTHNPLPRVVLDQPSHDELTLYHLGIGDHPNNLIASFLLTRQENFQSWKRATSINIAAKNKTLFIEGTIPRSPPNDPSRSAWDICNNKVMSWILQSVSREIAASIMFKTTAREMWTNLHDPFNQSNGPCILQLKTSVGNVKRSDNSVTTYFTQLQALWDELNEYQPNIPCTYGCTCGAMQKVQDYYTRDQILQFLIGLNESYWGIRVQIILYDPLPSLSKVFSMIIQQERQCCLGNTGVVAATSAKPNPNQPSWSKKPRLTCSNCLKPGHLVDKCYFLHSFPPEYGDKKKTTTTARANHASVTPTPDPSVAGSSQLQLSQQLISLLN
uniref:Retrotransposon Copia-like N-terminal domain-containing protein n=1 Tax=Cannabis sativa TaxID=3483 RepID=A0A803PZQ4_CANSA